MAGLIGLLRGVLRALTRGGEAHRLPPGPGPAQSRPTHSSLPPILPPARPWTDEIKPKFIAEFFASLPDRIPSSPDDHAAAVRHRAGQELAALNSFLLDREHDPRVPPDIDQLCAQIAARTDLYSTADWDERRNGKIVLDHTRDVVGRLSAAVRDLTDESSDEPSDDKDS